VFLTMFRGRRLGGSLDAFRSSGLSAKLHHSVRQSGLGPRLSYPARDKPDSVTLSDVSIDFLHETPPGDTKDLAEDYDDDKQVP